MNYLSLYHEMTAGLVREILSVRIILLTWIPVEGSPPM